MRIAQATDTDVFETTHKWLRDHNDQHVSGNWVPVRLVAYDDNDQRIGSLDAEVTWGKLHVSNVAVEPGMLRRGIGTQLMQAAEIEAAKNGCSGIYLETMSFQALEFYSHLGFTKAGELALE